MGVDIIQNCAVTGIMRDAAGAAVGVETTKGPIAATRIGVVAAGHTSVVMAMAGVRMPLESFPLQALVSEPVKPVMPCVVMSNTVHAYVSQSDKGELVIGGGTDAYTSYSQAGGLHIACETLQAICRAVPLVSATKDAAELGRHRRYHARPVSHHRADAGAGAVRELRVGDRRLQSNARVGAYLRRHHRSRGAASDRRAFRSGPVRVWPVDRRSRRCGGGALMLLIPCPWCGNRPENEFRYGGQANVQRPADPASVDDAAWVGIPISAR